MCNSATGYGTGTALPLAREIYFVSAPISEDAAIGRHDRPPLPSLLLESSEWAPLLLRAQARSRLETFITSDDTSFASALCTLDLRHLVFYFFRSSILVTVTVQSGRASGSLTREILPAGRTFHLAPSTVLASLGRPSRKLEIL